MNKIQPDLLTTLLPVFTIMAVPFTVGLILLPLGHIMQWSDNIASIVALVTGTVIGLTVLLIFAYLGSMVDDN